MDSLSFRVVSYFVVSALGRKRAQNKAVAFRTAVARPLIRGVPVTFNVSHLVHAGVQCKVVAVCRNAGELKNRAALEGFLLKGAVANRDCLFARVTADRDTLCKEIVLSVDHAVADGVESERIVLLVPGESAAAVVLEARNTCADAFVHEIRAESR